MHVFKALGEILVSLYLSSIFRLGKCHISKSNFKVKIYTPHNLSSFIGKIKMLHCLIYWQTSILHTLPLSYDIQSFTLKASSLKYLVFSLDTRFINVNQLHLWIHNSFCMCRQSLVKTLWKWKTFSGDFSGPVKFN